MISVHGFIQRDYINHSVLELGRNLKNHLDPLISQKK